MSQEEGRNRVLEIEDNNNNNNSSKNVPPYSHVPIVALHIRKAQQMAKGGNKSLIIDSASTTDIIGNKNILHDIRQSNNKIRVASLAGSSTIDQQGLLGEYPTPVWYYPEGNVNILSLNNVQKHYRCTMDTAKSNSININLKNGSTMKFRSRGSGLYSYDLGKCETIDGIINLFSENSPNIPEANMIDTVKDRADTYFVV